MINHIFINPPTHNMTEWFKQNLTLYSTPESRAAGKLSVLAIIEVIASVVIYWWIAAVWETQLHILVSLIAAPLYLLRSDESVIKAQVMWDRYINIEKPIKKNSPKYWGLLLSACLISGLLSYLLLLQLLMHFQEWSLFLQGFSFSLLVISISLAIPTAIVGMHRLDGVLVDIVVSALLVLFKVKTTVFRRSDLSAILSLQ